MGRREALRARLLLKLQGLDKQHQHLQTPSPCIRGSGGWYARKQAMPARTTPMTLLMTSPLPCPPIGLVWIEHCMFSVCMGV